MTDLTPVTLDRVIDTMKSFDVELEALGEDGVAAVANLNDTAMTFAVLGSSLIVRGDVVTDRTLADADPTLHLAANQINSVTFGARATIAEHAENLIVRTERDIPIAAGMNDEQLTTSLRGAVDAVLAAQDGLRAASADLDELRKQVEAELDADS